AKGIFDTSVESGDEVTPELSGLLSWSDDSDKFGISVFGSYQSRDSAAPSASSASWNIQPYSVSQGFIATGAQITNEPGLTDLTSVPRDSRLHFSEFSRERINGQVVLQFQAADNVRLTADATFAESENEEAIADQSAWFNRPFSSVVFDGNPAVSTTTFLAEIVDLNDDGVVNGVKDLAFQQEVRSTKDTLNSFGFNAEWDVSDAFKVMFDAHSSKAEASPNGLDGTARIRVGLAAPVLAEHSVDYSGDIPQQAFVIDDVLRAATTPGGFGTNANGILDLADIGSQIGRTTALNQENEVDQFRLSGEYSFDDDSLLDFGVDYRSASNRQTYVTTQQTLGNWGIDNPGDVEQLAPGALQEFCIACQFDDYDPGAAASANTAFIGDAATIYSALSAFYAGQGNAVGVNANNDDTVEEEVLSLYAQFEKETELFDRPANFVFGVRYEDTEVTSTSVITVPTALQWDADNDFTQLIGSTVQPVTESASYSNWLPSVDVSVEVKEDMILRGSYSRTLARTGYNNLFASATVNTPPGPTFLGNTVTGQSGNPGLVPLESDNFDLSWEWYFDTSSFVSVGAFEKRVRNFVGTGQTTRSLFDLRDPTSGAAGTRSGDAVAALNNLGVQISDVNLFTMTALIDQDPATAEATFQANLVGGALDQAFVDATLSAYDVVANSSDPLYQFEVTQPVNNREAKINGIEIAGQHFFGDTGFGVAGSYTLVDGDVGFDVGADPSVNQFALVGLSDTANLTLIYEDHGLSARLAYNWRDEFLSQTNRGGGFRNPAFTEAYSQFDLSVSYDLTENAAISLEGINITGEDFRSYGRDETNLWFAQEFDPRWMVGARYKF
ncbi:MAG: TonB-dependent receptor, partial [Pseudomonadota bacterium]